MKKRKNNLGLVILTGSTAIIWTIQIILDVIDGNYKDSTLLLILDGLCVVVWIVSFVIHLCQYHSKESEEKEQ